MKYKVGDRVIRHKDHRDFGPNDVKYWTATLTKRNEHSWDIITDTGRESRWSELYFHKLTPLEEAML